MEASGFINLDKVRNQTLAQEDLVEDAAFVARNVPVAFGIIYNLVENLENDLEEEKIFNGNVENFLFQLKYMLCAVETNTNKLHETLIALGYKKALYYQN
ncbi:hypothetical protein COMNV_00443 [Commensalibacter sp. Nvir]|uniref:hypothetical protein n=1 Tax=Commensalibacter sp. Nvir TaxID=3069817 RepID=UPI002D719341|nr:hypothetical protein COMNV_00443 [Commensalibacter sp. Nvir]